MITIPPADLGYIEEHFRRIARIVTEAYEDTNEPPQLRAATPDVLAVSLLRLFEVLRHFEPDQDPQQLAREDESANLQDVSALGNHGLAQLTEFALWAQTLGLSEAFQQLRPLSFALGVWLVRHGGELNTLDAMVDALAFIANSAKHPQDLETLFLMTNECVDGVAPVIAQDLDQSNPGRPWRLLLLNKAIIATRSHQPALMEEAFHNLVELLPEDAPNFFSEGMEQMDALDYPPAVREVMEKYFQLWCTPKRLH